MKNKKLIINNPYCSESFFIIAANMRNIAYISLISATVYIGHFLVSYGKLNFFPLHIQFIGGHLYCKIACG